jgi:hypothetical protein
MVWSLFRHIVAKNVNQIGWDSASEKENLWLKCDENTNLKRQLKQEYCNARDVFDKHLRKVKRQYQMKLQDDLLNDLEKPNSRDYWKRIVKIGISNRDAVFKAKGNHFV